MPRVHAEEPAEGPRDPEYYEQTKNEDEGDSSQQAKQSGNSDDDDL